MTRNSLERGEIIRTNEVGVIEEVSKLASTLSWGPTGVEATLATLIPEKVSLFFGEMDVMTARRQYEDFEKVMENRGASVLRVRDLAADALLEMGGAMPASSLSALRERIMVKAKSLVEKYGRGMGCVTDCIAEVLIEDTERYGEEGAIRLNAVLAQIDTEELPMANLLFGRDQSNMVGNTLLWSNMTHRIRRPEVDLWKVAVSTLLSQVQTVSVYGEGRLEGGDAIVHNGDCLIGVGGRSNLKGIEQVSLPILNQGLNLFVAYHGARDRGELEHQTTMHLDTFYMPGPKNTAVVLMEEAKQRELLRVVKNGSGIALESCGSFADYIIRSGEDIIPLSRQQQLDYQANYVVLDKQSVLLTVCGDGYLKREFEKRGVEVVDGNMSAITQGYGGAHCSITPILRV